MKGTLKDLRKIAKTSGMIRYSSLSKSKLQIALATHLAGNNQHSNDKASRKTRGEMSFKNNKLMRNIK